MDFYFRANKQNTPTTKEYEEALKVVKVYEKRKKDYNTLNRELGNLLKCFNSFKFDIDKKKKTVFFAGLLNNSSEVIVGKSVAKDSCVYEPIIGKLISILKALDSDYSWVEDYVEIKTSDNKFIVKDKIREGDFSIGSSKSFGWIKTPEEFNNAFDTINTLDTINTSNELPSHMRKIKF